VKLLRPLRHRTFRRVWAGQLLNGVGDGVFAVAVALLLLPRPDPGHALSVVLGLTSLGGVVSLLVGGALADRYRCSRVIVGADLLRAAGLLVLLLAGALGPMWALAAGACLMGLGSGLYRPAYSALLRDLVPDEDVRPASALRSMSNRLAAVVGGALGGLLAASLSARTALWIDLATFAVSLLTLVAVGDRRPQGDRGEEGTSLLQEVRDGLRYVRRRPWMVAVMVQGALQIALVAGPVAVLLPLLVGGDHSVLYGWVVALEGAGALLGATWGASLEPRRPGLVAMCALLAQLPQTLALALGAPAWTLLPCGALTGLGMSVFGVLWMTQLQLVTPREQLGRVLSVDALANSSLSPVGLLLVGALLPLLGTAALAWCASAVLLLSVLAVLPVPGLAGLGGDPAGQPDGPSAPRAAEGTVSA
jgi:MFS family permease